MNPKEHLGQHLGTKGVYDPPPLPVRHKKKKKKPVVLNPILGPKEVDVKDSAFANVVVSLVGGTQLHASRHKSVELKKVKAKETIFDKLSGTGRVRKGLGPAGFTFDGKSIDLSASTGNLPSISQSMQRNSIGARLEASNTKTMPTSLPPQSDPLRPKSSSSVTATDLAPLVMFPDKHDKLSGAFFAEDKTQDPDILFKDKDKQYKDPPKAPDPIRRDGTWDNHDLQFDISDAERKSDWYRWRNGITDSTLPPAKQSKNFVLVEESRLQNLSQFERIMQEEGNAIEFLSKKDSYIVEEDAFVLGKAGQRHLHNPKGSLNSQENLDGDGDGDGVEEGKKASTQHSGHLRGLIRNRTSKLDTEFEDEFGPDYDPNENADLYPGTEDVGGSSWISDEASESPVPRPPKRSTLVQPQTHTNVLNHTHMDPRKPTPQIAKALRRIGDQQFQLLVSEWTTLLNNWHEHGKANHYNREHLFKEYTAAKLLNATHEKEGREDWLLKNCPIETKVRKLKSAKIAYDTFQRRMEHDTMLFEDDRSFLYNKMYEARDRAVDYERYVFMCGLFGPMTEEEWTKAGSRPGLTYWVRATAAALQIQHCWDKFWSCYKLHRYRAARLVQTLWRKYYCLVNVTPLVRIRLKFGKRTYYYFVLATWQRYNYCVRNIRRLLHFRKYDWPNRCMSAWKQYVVIRTSEKKEIMRKFQKRFDIRSNIFHRILQYCKRFQYLKCMLRNMYYIPQFRMWVEKTQMCKRIKKLGKVVTPVQAFIRMKMAKIHFAKVRKSKRIMLRFCYLLRSRARVKRIREQTIDQHLLGWKPGEIVRRKELKDELERRRQLREIQLAEEKALASLAELQKHFKSWTTKGSVQIVDDLVKNKDPKILTKRQMEYSLLKRCYTANYEEQKFEYRTKKPPFIICADPLCGKIFAYEEAYIEHVQQMMDNPKKCTKGVLKSDVQSSIAERGLLKVGIKPVRMRNLAVVKARKGVIGRLIDFLEKTGIKGINQETTMTEEQEQAIAAEAAAEAAEKERQEALANAEKPKSAAEKLREKRALEKQKAEEKAAEELAAKEAAKAAKKEAKRLKKQAAKMSDRQKRKAGLDKLDDDEETEEEKEKRLKEELEEKEAKRIAEEAEKARIAEEEAAMLAAVAKEEEEKKKKDAADAELAEIEKANATVVHIGLRRHTVFPMANYAKFHLLMKHPKGFTALRNYLLRKCGHSRIINTLDCWENIQMWRMGSIYSPADYFVQRALFIYENFLRDDCDRPIAIHMADGNIVNAHRTSIASVAMNALAAAVQVKKDRNVQNNGKKKGLLKAKVKKVQQAMRLEEEKAEDAANENEGIADFDWWDILIDRLLDVKNREYIGFFGTTRAQKNWFRAALGLRGKLYQSWSERRTVNTDIFDGLEWACFQYLYKHIYYIDKMTVEDENAENEMDRLELKKDRKERALRKAKADKIDLKHDQKYFRLAREACTLIVKSMHDKMREMRNALKECMEGEDSDAESTEEDYWKDTYWDIEESDPCNQFKNEAIELASEQVAKALHMNSKFSEDLIDDAIVLIMQQEFVFLGEPPGVGGHLAPLPPTPRSEVDEEEVYEVVEYVMGKPVRKPSLRKSAIKKEKEKVEVPEASRILPDPEIVIPEDYKTIKLFEYKPVQVVIKQFELMQALVNISSRHQRKEGEHEGLTRLGAAKAKKESVLVKARNAAIKLESDKTIPPFNRSTEYYNFKQVQKLEAVDHAKAFREDYRRSRWSSIQDWSKEFKLMENEISVVARKAAAIVLEQLVDNMTDKACQICTKEKVFEISYEEQQRPEALSLMNDDATCFVEENMLDHVFDHYVYALIDTMLGMPDQREGCLEYGGFLKGQKQLKKKLELKVVEAGRRVDDSWFKNALKAAIEDDLKHMPLDYMGCIRLVQRRFRGMRGRNIARREFAKYWLKKYDPSTKKVYYVFGKPDPPEVTWERPKFMLHLYPETTW